MFLPVATSSLEPSGLRANSSMTPGSLFSRVVAMSITVSFSLPVATSRLTMRRPSSEISRYESPSGMNKGFEGVGAAFCG